MKARVILGRDRLGDEATPEDLDRWVDYVTDHIAAACGFSVEVELRLARDDVQSDDAQAATDEERETVRGALRHLWDRWSAEGAR